MKERSPSACEEQRGKEAFPRAKLLTGTGSIRVGIWDISGQRKSLDGFVVIENPLVDFAISG